ncbi:hypothetical protein MBLNU230_g6841t1 [Neophaeotheca triangularis]
MAPAAKRRKFNRKRAATRYLCKTCDTQRVSSQFHAFNPTDDCKHLIHTCKACLREWIEFQIDNGAVAAGGIKCPECEEVMEEKGVGLCVPKAVFKRFEELHRRHVADSTPGWRWCMSASCRAGKVHVSPDAADVERELREAKKAAVEDRQEQAHRKALNEYLTTGKKASGKLSKSEVSAIEDEVLSPPDVWTCDECGAKACVPCDRPWHEGETCDEYKKRTRDREDEEDRSLKTIEQLTRKCPKCRRPIQKNGGCPSMFCSQCRTNFCWECMEAIEQPYGDCKCVRDGQAARAAL